MTSSASHATGVYVTGSGVISCAGNSPAQLWENTHAGRTGVPEGIGRITGHLVDPSDPTSNAKISADENLNKALEFSIIAIRQAMTKAGWENLRETDGLILATTTGQIPIWDKALVSFLRGDISRDEFELAFIHQPIGNLLDAICNQIEFTGRSFLTATACTAATQAIALGAAWIQQGRVQRCLVVGTEVLCTLTLEGFRSLQLLSPRPCQPFDRDRSGINLSEGSAALCLEAGPEARGRALAKIDGAGLTTDGYHMTAPEPGGNGCLEAIRIALNSSGLEPKDISWIHAHGTGSQHNDSSEGKAIAALFGTHPDAAPFVSSTKGIHGHALGASGAIETVLCLEALAHQIVLKTPGLTHPDPTIQVRHAHENTPFKIDRILKLTLGFGGANATIIFSRPDLEVQK